MKNLSHLFLGIISWVLLFSPVIHSQQIPDGPYLGQKPPGTEAEIFALDIISLDQRFEHGATFSPDGKEFFYTITNSAWSSLTLMYMREENGQWTSPTKAPFSGTSDNGEALFSPDGQKLYFLSTRSPGYKPYGTDIWMTQRIEKGWSEPVHLGYPVNSTERGTWHPTVTSEGTLYFSSRRSGGTGGGDIYRAKLVDNGYPTVENVGAPVNTTKHDADAFIAPDESYIIFHSTRSGGHGNFDLYINFQNEDSSWTEPQNMGSGINTSDLEHSPTVTIDGKYLFFGRRNDQIGNGDIYWVDSKVIDEFRPDKPDTTSGIEREQSLPRNFELNQNFPNPFNPTTTIRYSLAKPSRVQLNIYNMKGQKIKTLMNTFQTSGQHSVSWDASDEQGCTVSSGLYFYQISTPEFNEQKKMLLVR